MFAQREDVGAVGARLLYPDDTIQHAGVILGIGGCAGHANKIYTKKRLRVTLIGRNRSRFKCLYCGLSHGEEKRI